MGYIIDFFIYKPLDDISGVHIDDNKRTKCDLLELFESSSDKSDCIE